MSLIRAQVVFQQGLVVEVLADGEMTMAAFVARIERAGKVRSIRGLRDATPADVAGGTPIERLPDRS